MFVYQIHTHKYLTSADFTEVGLFEVYEINNPDEFEQFLHEEHRQVQGRSMFLSQDELNGLIEEINRQIHSYRQSTTIQEKQQGAIHIVMSESAAGSLRVGLPRPKTVIGVPDSLSIGPLWKLHEKIGQNFRNEWLFENINYEQEDGEMQQKFNNTLLQIEDISNDVPIYIWYGNNADEQIGLRFILYLLREKTNDIYLMNSTDLYEKYRKTNEKQAIFHTAQVDADFLELIFERIDNHKLLTAEECRQFRKEWEKLSETRDVLCSFDSDEILALPEDHYDSLILESIENLHNGQETKEFIKVGLIIGEIYQHQFIDIFFLEYRIRHLIYNELLELKGIPRSMRHYSVRLR
ncbi:DUF1835 domain-containing protein [Solibacillus sp. CAU 1738]|uniref:DUF1835 domain-containing protein n=1 Tax=Solibacillus sp. CAU 1738 TaxID=3140363 RepID=UPI00326108A0